MKPISIGRAFLFSLFAALPLLIPGFSFQENPAAVGTPAPAFRLVGLDGKTYASSEFQGMIMVLEWTNPECPYVVRHYKEGLMPALQKEYKDKGIVWLTVNSTNPNHPNYKTAEALNEIYGAWKVASTALLMDADGKAGRAFGAKTTPHMFVIDKEGKLAYSGAVDDDPRGNKETRMNYVRAAVDALLGGKPVATTTTQPYGCSVKYAD